MQIIKAPKIYAEYPITSSVNATTPLEMKVMKQANVAQRAILEAVTERTYFYFGPDATAGNKADKTVNADGMVTKGYSVAAGMAIEVTLEPGVANRFVSVQGTTGGVGIVKLVDPQGDAV